MHKEVREVISYAESLGFELWGRRLGSGHLRLVHENGAKVTMSATPGGGRWRKNCESQLRRAAKGLAI